MGLDTTHGCWHGAYSAFSRWRYAVVEAAGYEFAPDPELDERMFPVINWDAITDANLQGEWEITPEDPLLVLIAHSDCDGEIKPAQAGPLADRLDQILPKLSSGPDYAWGHIARDGGVRAVTKRFIRGLRLAVKRNEPVEFH